MEQFDNSHAESMIRPRAEDDFDSLRPDENIRLGVFEDSGGLNEFHVNNEAQEEGTRRSKLFAGAAVAVLVAIGGAYGVSVYLKDQPVVADSSLPTPTAPSKTAAMTPPAPATPAPAIEASAPTAPAIVKPAPVTKEAATANAPKVMAAPRSSSVGSMTLTPEQQYTAPAVTPAPANVPEPAIPAPAPVQAGNPALNQQSAEQPAEPQATPAPVPAEQTPAPAEPVPAQ